MSKPEATFVVVSAPSGSGKDTVIRNVCKQMEGIGVSVSFTSRKPRKRDDGSFEQEGVEYFFLERAEFEAMARAGGFFEYMEDNKGDLYGTSNAYLQKLIDEGNDIIIMNVDNLGAKRIKELVPEAVSIFILPPSAQEVRRRLIERGAETADQIEKRLIKGAEQMKAAHTYDYVVLNDDLATAVQDVIHIIGTVRRQTQLHLEMIERVKASFADWEKTEDN